MSEPEDRLQKICSLMGQAAFLQAMAQARRLPNPWRPELQRILKADEHRITGAEMRKRAVVASAAWGLPDVPFLLAFLDDTCVGEKWLARLIPISLFEWQGSRMWLHLVQGQWKVVLDTPGIDREWGGIDFFVSATPV